VPSGLRHTTGAFERWDRAWHAVEAYRFGLVHIWWSGTRSGTSQVPTPELVEQMQAEAREIVRTGRTQYPLTLRNQHRAWGTFAAADPPPSVFSMGSDSGYGWPFPCLYYQVFTVYDPIAGSTVSDTSRGALVLWGTPESRWHEYRALPLRPIATGLAANSLFYSVLWSVLLFVPGVIRRRVRKRHNRCAACGYDLAGTAGKCPECGGARP
jgi:hypothetical protein